MSNERVLTGIDLYKKKELLREIKSDKINWITYFLDEKTQEKWIEEYLHSEMHGGGPPQLRLLTKFPWE